jgi:8-oxo-dGTP pyrophosphatase MutT (NUDIX family)
MRIVAVDTDGNVVMDAPLGHGVDPGLLVWDHGHLPVRPLNAARDAGGELIITLQVRPLAGEARPAPAGRGQDLGLNIPKGLRPIVRQRAAGYAVVLSERGLLATQYSARTAVAGRWGMPGGGIDDHEEPVAAVLREVAEETSQLITLGELIKVQTSHWIGRSPHGPIEDFHAVRLIYRGSCATPTNPVVLDRGGTTEAARWVALKDWRSLTWTQNWHQVLAELLADRS